MGSPCWAESHQQSTYQSAFEHEKILGSGGFALVFQAKCKSDGLRYAVKEVRFPNEDGRSEGLKEVKAMSRLEHPGIVRYYSYWCEELLPDQLLNWNDKLRTDSKCPSTLPYSTSSLSKERLKYLSTSDTALQDEESVGYFDTLPLNQEDELKVVDNSLKAERSERLATSNNEIEERSDSGVVFDHRLETEDGKYLTRSSGESQRRKMGNDRLPRYVLYIQMELCHEESLKGWLSPNNSNRNEIYDQSMDIFTQLVDAVAYIHDKRIIHRDLKPANILLSLDEKAKFGKIKVKVSDFGLACSWRSPSNEESQELDEPALSSGETGDIGTGRTVKIGTRLYASPEQLEIGSKYCCKTDIFSLGIIFFELFHEFGSEAERGKILPDLRDGKTPESFEENMPLQNELVLRLLAQNPCERPSAEDILKDKVFLKLSCESTKSKQLDNIATSSQCS